VLAWRIVRPAYAENPLSGIGAALAGTRWAPEGVRIGYASTSRPLAVLEMLVHFARKNVPFEAVMVPLEIPDDLIAGLPHLPEGWNHIPYRPASQQIGNQWVVSDSSLAMFVPSAIIPAERNILINPTHAQFSQIRIGKPEPHAFDRRLFKLR
jgi:RES domain-containing protein